MKNRDSALKKAIKTGRDTDRLCYKSNYYLHLMNEAKGNSKLIWKNMNTLLRKEPNFTGDVKLKVKGKLVEDDCAIATIFNNFFY